MAGLMSPAALTPSDSGVGDTLGFCRAGFQLASSMCWMSYDPFDLLLIPSGDAIRRRSRLAGQSLIALGKRSGPRLRRLVRIAPHEEAKAVADFLSAAALMARLGIDWSRPYVESLSARLGHLAVETESGVGWGLAFPYVSRYGSAAPHTPNTYTTVSCVAALMDAAACMADERLLAMAVAGSRTISADLGLVSDGVRRWFRYWPGDETCVVNAQALIAGCFQELGVRTDDRGLVAQAELAAEVATSAQRADGSFPYALDRRGQFVDVFHTGFVLDGLTRFSRAGGRLERSNAVDAVNRGLRYLRARLIAPDRRPRSSPDGPPAADGQSIGQLIQTLTSSGDPGDGMLARTIWHSRAAADLVRPISAGRTPRRRSLRWDIGPMVLAGAHLWAAQVESR